MEKITAIGLDLVKPVFQVHVFTEEICWCPTCLAAVAGAGVLP